MSRIIPTSPNRTTRLGRRHPVAGLIVLICVAALMALPSPAAHAAAAKKAAPKSSVARPIPGETFTLSGTLKRSVARTAILQRAVGKRWVAVKRARIPASGRYQFSITQPSYRTSWRVIARATTVHGKRYPARKSRARTLTRMSQTGTVAVTGAARVGTTVKATATFAPVRRGRAARIEVNDGSGWKVIARGTQNAQGRLAATWKASERGMVQFRAITSAQRGAGAFTTSAQSLAVLPTEPIQISAHRGYSSKYAENSWQAFRGAFQQRSEWIETDFRLSKANETEVLAAPDPTRPELPVNPACAGPAGTRFWVIQHDNSFTRATNVRSVFPKRASDAVGTFTCLEIKQLKVNTVKTPNLTDFGVLTLAEFVAAVRSFEASTGHTQMRLMIEYKGSRVADFANLYDQVRSLAPEWIDPESHNDKAVFTSFWYASVFESLLDPTYGTGGEVSVNERVQHGAELGAILNESSDKLPAPPAESNAHWLQVQYAHTMLTPARAAAARAVADQVVAWTPVTTASIQRAAALGADVITSGALPVAQKALLR